ncbi:hypothetical protein H4O18_12400 [Arenibacter sp. BSSL-BM3]|uniref:Uncharacterized protein n=1 Tax=Arenibacter arenosicollis TaxID=2762274 RepID=A0ABR7QNP1_9FLAO|nr:hypothetical protein [Arenibacter arenosicollis]MBC8768796.1 hypothetical protein [Arenibacter arenosicollis]
MSHNILLKTIAYFKIAQVQLTPNNTALEKAITKTVSGVTITNPSSQLIFIGTLNHETINKYIVQNVNITNDTIVYVDKIHETKDTNKLWKSIKELEKIRVSIDLFYGGLLFFRREQVKEHFKIRI